MPVDFQIKNAKVKAVGALVMMMHASEIAEGNHWQKVIAERGAEGAGAERLLRLPVTGTISAGRRRLAVERLGQRQGAGSDSGPAEDLDGQDRPDGAGRHAGSSSRR